MNFPNGARRMLVPHHDNEYYKLHDNFKVPGKAFARARINEWNCFEDFTPLEKESQVNAGQKENPEPQHP